MATHKAPSKAEFLEALKKKGINTLEDLIEAIMPETDETGGFLMDMGEGSDAAGDFLDMVPRFKFRGHGPDVWKGPIVAGLFSLYGE
ncbi:MAG: hypothetical protein IH963_00765 [Chloroflexi bacterium]|nr:hypothetical protein [Chloroflexota bacterium]